MLNQPEKHWVHCLLLARCQKNGYFILQKGDAGKFDKIVAQFDADGNAKAITFLQTLQDRQNVVVTVDADVGAAMGTEPPTTTAVRSIVLADTATTDGSSASSTTTVAAGGSTTSSALAAAGGGGGSTTIAIASIFMLLIG